MTKGPRHALSNALTLAHSLRQYIGRDIDRYLIVGSAGRAEPTVGDLDILVAVRDKIRIERIRRTLKQIGEYEKGGDRNMKVNKLLGSSMRLDLYLCHPPAQWGCLVAYRINPVPLVIWIKETLDASDLKRGGGTIRDQFGNVVPIPEEKDLFKLVGIHYTPPTRRHEIMRELGL